MPLGYAMPTMLMILRVEGDLFGSVASPMAQCRRVMGGVDAHYSRLGPRAERSLTDKRFMFMT